MEVIGHQNVRMDLGPINGGTVGQDFQKSPAVGIIGENIPAFVTP
jgi:hypothetical protein